MANVAPHIRSVVDRDGAVILDIERDQFFTMNPVGAYIWTRLKNGEDLDQIVRALAEETDMDVAVVSADVDDFMSELKNRHLLSFPV